MILTFKSRPIQRVSRYKRRICDNQLGKGEVSNVSEGKVGSPSRVVRTVRAVSFHLFGENYENSFLLRGTLSHYANNYFRSIPSQGNTAEVTLTVFHRNFLGVRCHKLPLSDNILKL